MKHSLTPVAKKHQFLFHCSLCRGLGASELWRLAEQLVPETREAGESICLQGDPADVMYVVGRGLLEVFLHGPSGEERVIGRLGPGDHFGEMALLDGGLRTASVRSASPSTLLALHRGSFEELLSDSPRFAANLCRALGLRLQATNRGRLQTPRPQVIAFVRGSDTLLDRVDALRHELENGQGDCAWISDRFQRDEVREGLRTFRLPDSELEDLVSKLRSNRGPVVLDVGASTLARGAEVVRCAEEIWWWVDAEASDTPEAAVPFLASHPRLAARSRPVWVGAKKCPKERTGRESPFGLEPLFSHRSEDTERGALFSTRRLARRLHGHRLGLALGGGGSRGLAHLGVLRVLEAEGVQPDHIAGTSSGALMALIYAAGMPPEEAVEMLVRELSPGPVLRRLPASSRLRLWASFRFGRFQRKLEKYFGGARLESLPIPCSTVAVDLFSGNTVVRDSGDAVQAVLESINLPVFSRPIMRDGMALVDGGVLDNLPAGVLLDRGVDSIVGVDVMAGLPPENVDATPPRPGPLDGVLRVLEVQQRRLATSGATHTDLRITPEVTRFDFTDFSRGEEIYKAGMAGARESLDSLLELMGTPRA